MTEWRTIYSRAHTKEIIESLQAGDFVGKDDLVVLLGFLLEADDKILALVHGNAIAATVQSPKPKILDASEVMVEGIYWHLYGGMVNPVTVRFGGVWVMYFCGVEKPEPLFGKFIGPLPKPEV